MCKFLARHPNTLNIMAGKPYEYLTSENVNFTYPLRIHHQHHFFAIMMHYFSCWFNFGVWFSCLV